MVRMLKRPRLGSAVYVLPNLITTGNLFFGFFSIGKSLKGDFEQAAIGIMLAALFDMLDGSVARLTRGGSEFGVQYDSLCDLVSFGLAPAFLMYQFGLMGVGKLGWILCFLYLACGALRLARFNVQSSIGKAHGDFTGLPIPMAALFVATFIQSGLEVRTQTGNGFLVLRAIAGVFESQFFNVVFLGIAALSLALLMVSNIAYRSHKSIKFRAIKPFKILVVAVIALGIIAFEPGVLGFAIALAYVLSGPFEWVIGWKKAHDDDEFFAPLADDDSVMEPAPVDEDLLANGDMENGRSREELHQ